jgi:2-polyprenyl-3-methyl-5-hydroxy-6-metoxy-1,4-benzoquinol methylase
VSEFKYAGSELELFAGAANWKNYWASAISPFCGSRILDVGAGIGSTARALFTNRCKRWLALEPDANLASRIKAALGQGAFGGNLEVRVGSTCDLLGGELFDTILYIDVLEHIEDDKSELKRAAAHLASDGCIVVLSPAHQWLYTPFDQAIGHVRRYSRKTLLAAAPDVLLAERILYMDSVGLLASLGNRLVLRSSQPNAAQIELWDGWMVPISRVVDRITFNHIGKSILGVFRRAA